MTNSTHTASANAPVDVRLIAHFQGPYESRPTRILSVGGKLIAEFCWERGWCRASSSQAVGIFKRYVEKAVLRPGDLVVAWTQGWQLGHFIQQASDEIMFVGLAGGLCSAKHVEPFRLTRGQPVLAKVEGTWKKSVHLSTSADQFVVRTSGDDREHTVTEIRLEGAYEPWLSNDRLNRL